MVNKDGYRPNGRPIRIRPNFSVISRKRYKTGPCVTPIGICVRSIEWWNKIKTRKWYRIELYLQRQTEEVIYDDDLSGSGHFPSGHIPPGHVSPDISHPGQFTSH